MLTQQLVQGIWSSSESPTAEYIYQKLKEAEDIAKTIHSLEKEQHVERARHEENTKIIKGKIKQLQEKCQHWSRTYHPDPSGNSDSYYTCDTCNKWM
jgi:hypothetical protein